MKPSPSEVRSKVRAGIGALAWVSAEYFKINQKWVDADDYIQTMIIFESLMARGGFDHADLVARFRTDRPTAVCGMKVKNNGVDHKGQIYRLKKDPNPLYLATTGFTPGCAMKALPMAVWEPDLLKMASLADAVTRVTHGAREARLAGVLTAIRHRHALLGVDDPEFLIKEWSDAAEHLGLRSGSGWDRMNLSVGRAWEITRSSTGAAALRGLLHRVGLMYFAWSVPVSAVFWSYVIDPAFKKIFVSVGSDKKFTVGGEQILVDSDVQGEYAEHLKTHRELALRWLEEPGKTGRQDSDTFFSIAFTSMAMRDPGFLTEAEIAVAAKDFGEDWSQVLDAVAKRWSA